MGLEFHNIHYRYDAVEALSGINLSVGQGDILCLLGQSGCGKSTLLNLTAGNLALQTGEIRLDGNILASAHQNPPPEQRPVGLVFQEGALFPHLTVAQNIGFGVKDKSRRAGVVNELLDQIGLGGFGDRFPHSLSGGQQQRVAVARALAPEPAILLMDEPFASIDIMLRRRLREEIRQILKARDCISILVTHDPEEAIETADQIAVMESGVISQIGTAEDLYNDPTSLLVGLMAGEGAILNGQKKGDQVETPFGAFALNTLSINGALKEGEACRILLRPFAARVTPNSEGAIIIDLRRTGQSQIVTLRNGRGKTLLLQTFPDIVLSVGQTVSLDIADMPVPAFTL